LTSRTKPWRAACVDVTVQTRGSIDTLSGCTSDVPAHAIQRATVVREAGRHDRCRPDFRLLHGVVAPSVRRVTGLLGDGRRRSVRTVALRDRDLLARIDELGVPLLGSMPRMPEPVAAP